VITIPDFIVEFFLIGRTRREALERYTQDAGIVTDVWPAFAKNVEQSQRVLIAPSKGTSAGDIGFALSRVITAYRRREFPQKRESAGAYQEDPLRNRDGSRTRTIFSGPRVARRAARVGSPVENDGSA
jgi:hypothetical protein